MRMNREKLVLVASMVALIVGFAVGVTGEETGKELCVPLGAITLSAPADVEAKRSPVEFPHGAHFTYSCNRCHHKWTGTDQFLGCGTSGCHDLTTAPKEEEKDGQQAQRYYKNAFHKSCIACHKEIKESNRKLAASGSILEDKLPATGPTGCRHCHPKE